MGYEPIKVIAWAETDLNGHVNRVTEFDETSQSNKLSYRDGFPHITCVPNGQNTRGPRLVDYNGLFYLFSSFLFELQQGNFPTYNSAIVGAGKPLPNGYPQGAVLWYAAGGYFVKSLVANNTESDLSNTNNWAKITVSAADLLQAVPTGSIQPYAGASIPSGWLLCDGSAVSRTTYSDLFSVISTVYGTGDGSTTFNLPDFTDKTFWGGTAVQAGTVKAAGLPNIQGSISNVITRFSPTISGCIEIDNQDTATQNMESVRNQPNQTLKIDASKSNAIYGNSSTVQPPAIQVPFIIKY